MGPARWRTLLERYVAGEPIRALSAEYRVHVSTIYRQAAKARMRKRDVKAKTLPKGPAPVVVRAEAGEVRVVCAELAFRFDAGDPEATVASIYERVTEAAPVGRDDLVSKLYRMANQTLILADRLDRRRERRSLFAREAAPADGPAGAPLVLRESQRPPRSLPDGSPWSTWLFLGGRGAGKTLAGASWLADQAEALGPRGRLALIGPTLHDVREVMIEGVSGIRSLPRWTRATRPRFEASRRRLVFANGCQAYAFSAEDPDSLRGPQFSAAWADEFCAWRGSGPRGAAETLALLRMGLRLPLSPKVEGRGSRGEGDSAPDLASASQASSSLDPRPSTLNPSSSPAHPRLVVTTTPRPTRALVRLRDEASCVHTHAPTAANAGHLSPGFLDGLQALYGGTRRAAQELEGLIVELDGALFTAAMMARARRVEGRGAGGEGDAAPDPAYDRVVVAIDPTASAGGAACGLIAAARYRRPDGVRCADILADRSIAGLGPDAWARRAVGLAGEFGASALVAEVNQGGDMVKAVLKTAGAKLKIREVHATRGKYVRAEPVAALYEQGRIRHAGAFDALEEELMAFGGEMEAAGSLDRADALVWAITDLLVDAPDGERGPRVSRL